jgi:3-methyladenine DNA glycosylase AlkD
MPEKLTAEHFLEKLVALQSDDELRKIQRFFKSGEGAYSEGDEFIGVRMGAVFDLAKTFIEMKPDEIEVLLENKIHEMRVGGVSIMDFQARSKKFTASHKEEIFKLYIRRHDRINNWDLVDRAAPHVVGGFLSDKPRTLLYELARSENMWERRTSIVSTWFFIRKGDVDDTFNLAEILLHDKEDLIHKATGGWIRAAGSKDRKKLLQFLDRHAYNMPRVALRYAIEHLDPQQKKHYIDLKKS